MIKSILVPAKKDQHYYDPHYRFFINMAKAVGVGVKTFEDNRKGKGFPIWFRNYRALIDFGDHTTLADDIDKFDIIFKYHYSKHKHADGMAKLYPLVPISFLSWTSYERLLPRIVYTARDGRILNNQRPGAAAKERRTNVQRMLLQKYGIDVDRAITDQLTFWLKINKAFVAVCVPGARNDILDRGQWQQMAFGTCTISPRLDIMLNHWREPMPGIHYVECAADYSDLLDVIERCRSNRAACVEIGRNAKELFAATATPERVWAWINTCAIEQGLGTAKGDKYAPKD